MLIFKFCCRTEISTQNDLLSYRPAAGDLLYPEMFLMMKDIESKQSKNQMNDSTKEVPIKTSLNAMDQVSKNYCYLSKHLLSISAWTLVSSKF